MKFIILIILDAIFMIIMNITGHSILGIVNFIAALSATKSFYSWYTTPKTKVLMISNNKENVPSKYMRKIINKHCLRRNHFEITILSPDQFIEEDNNKIRANYDLIISDGITSFPDDVKIIIRNKIDKIMER